MKMENIKIKHDRKNYWYVTADTKRFGKQEILFEGISLDECIGYIGKNQRNAAYTMEVMDAWNERKIWLIKHSKCRHYSINQMIGGRKIYGKFTRTTKQHVNEIISGIQEEERKIL